MVQEGLPTGKAGYKYLTTYMLSVLIYDLTADFCNRFLSFKSPKYPNFPSVPNSRTIDQMIQAGRSGKQNICEGYAQGTSLKGYIKLLGVAKGSIQELLEDYEDFLRQRGLELWGKDAERIRVFREFRVFWKTPNSLNSPIPLINPNDPTAFANLLVTLCRQELFLLDRQIKSLEEKFIKEGGYTEKLFKRRLDSR